MVERDPSNVASVQEIAEDILDRLKQDPYGYMNWYRIREMGESIVYIAEQELKVMAGFTEEK